MKKKLLSCLIAFSVLIFSGCAVTYKEESNIYGQFIQSYTVELSESECRTISEENSKINNFFKSYFYYIHSGDGYGLINDNEAKLAESIIWMYKFEETDNGVKITDTVIYDSKEVYDNYNNKGLVAEIKTDNPVKSKTFFYDITTYEVVSPFYGFKDSAIKTYNREAFAGYFNEFWDGVENFAGFKRTFPGVSVDFGKEIMLEFIKATNTFSGSNGEKYKEGNLHVYKWVDLGGVNADLQLQLSVYSARREVWYGLAIIITAIFGGVLYLIFKLKKETQKPEKAKFKKPEDIMDLYDKNTEKRYTANLNSRYGDLGYRQGGYSNSNPYSGYNSGNNNRGNNSDPFAGYNSGNNNTNNDPFAGYNSGNNNNDGDPFSDYNKNDKDKK